MQRRRSPVPFLLAFALPVFGCADSAAQWCADPRPTLVVREILDVPVRSEFGPRADLRD